MLSWRSASTGALGVKGVNAASGEGAFTSDRLSHVHTLGIAEDGGGAKCAAK